MSLSTAHFIFLPSCILFFLLLRFAGAVHDALIGTLRAPFLSLDMYGILPILSRYICLYFESIEDYTQLYLICCPLNIHGTLLVAMEIQQVLVLYHMIHGRSTGRLPLAELRSSLHI